METLTETVLSNLCWIYTDCSQDHEAVLGRGLRVLRKGDNLKGLCIALGLSTEAEPVEGMDG